MPGHGMQPTPASGRGGRRTLAVTYGGRVRACCRCSRGREVRRGSAREVRSIRSARCISAHHALVPLCRARRDWRINLSRARRRPLGSSFLFVSSRHAGSLHGHFVPLPRASGTLDRLGAGRTRAVSPLPTVWRPISVSRATLHCCSWPWQRSGLRRTDLVQYAYRWWNSSALSRGSSN